MILLFASAALAAQSSYYFSYSPVSNDENAQWIQPNETARFAFHLFENDKLSDPAIEERLRLVGVFPYFYGVDSATVEKSSIQSVFTNSSWSFDFRASAPGQFCYRVRPNVEAMVSIRESSVCFGVSNIIKSPGQTFIGKIRKHDQIFNGDVIANASLEAMYDIRSSPFSVFATFNLRTAQIPGIPFYSRILTTISPNSFGDTYYHLFNFADYPELMDQVSFYYMRPDDGVVVLAGGKPLLLTPGQESVVLAEGTFADMAIGCTQTECRYAFVGLDRKSVMFDSDGGEQSFAQDETVQEVAFNAVDYENCAVLLNTTSGRYRVMPFKLVDGEYVAGQAVSLPSNQPPAVLYTEPPLVNHETTFTGSKMTLTAIHAHQSTYGHMFLYGSSLLHSPAFGYGWFLIASFGDDSIKDFASSPVSGKFAFIMTNNHSIFLGTTGSKYMSQFNALDYFDLETLEISRLFFGADDFLFLISVNSSGSITRHMIPLDYFSRNDADCPYLNVNIVSDNPLDVTRLRGIVGLPQSIYLDRNGEYSFSVVFGQRASAQPDFDIIANGNFNLTLESINSSINDVVSYSATIKGNPSETRKVISGDDFYRSPIIVRVSNAAPRCEFTESTITAHIGCPQGLRLALRPYDEAESAMLDCAVHDAECVSFDKSWWPRFVVEDTIDGTVSNYTGLFTMMVIGAGKAKETITRFSDSQIEQYNTGKKKIWVFEKSSESVANQDNSSVLWICEEGSPCSGVRPEGFRAPQMYLLFKATTNISYDSSSYCSLETEFIICLVSLPLSFAYQMLCLLLALIVCILINMYCYMTKVGGTSRLLKNEAITSDRSKDDRTRQGNTREPNGGN